MKNLSSLISQSTLSLSILCLPYVLPAAVRMDYRDAGELGAVMADLAEQSSHAQLFVIGYSTDYHSNPNRPQSYPIYALRISESTNERIQDDPHKNSILFEAGTHPREWLATESCLTLAEHLVAHAEDPDTEVPELLGATDVWIIPLTTVAGRVLDDADGGDPRHFSTSPSTAGWRGNGDTRDCEYGVNVARNFSRGWDDAEDACGSSYRGYAPFSTGEAAALRNFVQNHGISMAVVIHSNAEQIWNLWGDDDRAGRGIAELAQLFWRIWLDDERLALSRESVGNGMGQFSAWLSRASDQSDQPDYDSIRGIQTIFIELPFLNENYGGHYRAAAHDGSNGFHPSGDHVRDLIRLNFILMAEDLIRQSRAPGAPSLGDWPWRDRCPNHDFGLVAAKISTQWYQAGSLETYAASENNGAITPARDYLTVGQYDLRYRVQNFSSDANRTAVDVRLTVTRPNARAGRPDVQVSSVLHSWTGLQLQEGRAGRFALDIDRDNTDYTVILEARPALGFTSGVRDNFSRNDKKVFKFRSYRMQ